MIPEETNQRYLLTIQNVSKSYKDNNEVLPVIEPITLNINAGELLVLVGPSGCGKTTLLRIIAGLESPSTGKVLLENQPVNGPGRDRGMVFQDFTSFPWLTVRRNVAFGMRLHEHDPAEVVEHVDHWLKLVGLEKFARFYPGQLSGGMQQRVAIARTLANDPLVVLMDEPFGGLDAQTRWQMQELLLQLRQETSITIVFVTHDVEEAVFLADRVAVLSARPARIIQEYEIPWGQQRDRALIRSVEFLELERIVHTAIRGELSWSP